MRTTKMLACLGTVAVCFLGRTAVQAEEVPLTKEEMVAGSTNTVSKLRCDNGWSGEQFSGSDGTVKSTGRCRAGVWETDEGTWAIVDSPDGLLQCVTWQKSAPACWRIFKDGDRYVAHESGGKGRTCWFTRTASPK
jgi:hypothetical protein